MPSRAFVPHAARGSAQGAKGGKCEFAACARQSALYANDGRSGNQQYPFFAAVLQVRFEPIPAVAADGRRGRQSSSSSATDILICVEIDVADV